MLQLTYIGNTTIPVEAECIVPDQLAGKTVAEIAALPVQHGNMSVPLGEFFRVTGDAGDQSIVVAGDCSKVKLVGHGMRSGHLLIDGPIGMHVGAEIRGGTLDVHGSAADWAGAEMCGGLLRIRGDAGHQVGGCYRGGRTGMRGGMILVDGDAGNEVGHSLRRGFIAIGGRCGDFAGAGMIAGTLFLFGDPGLRLGAGMKRGTIATFGPRPELLPTFRYAHRLDPTFLAMYVRRLQEAGFSCPVERPLPSCDRYSGDLVALGKGEVLVFGD